MLWMLVIEVYNISKREAAAFWCIKLWYIVLQNVGWVNEAAELEIWIGLNVLKNLLTWFLYIRVIFLFLFQVIYAISLQKTRK